MLALGLHSKDRESTKDKANTNNPKVNRGCPPLTANRTSADCVQISLRPSIQRIPPWVYRTGGFNAPPPKKNTPPQKKNKKKQPNNIYIIFFWQETDNRSPHGPH